MKPILIAIAGGSGSGKSTLAEALCAKYPDEVGLVQFDDYRKLPSEMPTYRGMQNRDHPDSMQLETFVNDLTKLSEGNSVVINTRNEHLNPEFAKTRQKLPVEFKPKKIMLIEGHMILGDERVRNLLETSIWLEAPHEARWKRRQHFPGQPESYERVVYKPMHLEHVEAKKDFAEHVIDAGLLSKEHIFEEADRIISRYL